VCRAQTRIVPGFVSSGLRLNCSCAQTLAAQNPSTPQEIACAAVSGHIPSRCFSAFRLSPVSGMTPTSEWESKSVTPHSVSETAQCLCSTRDGFGAGKCAGCEVLACEQCIHGRLCPSCAFGASTGVDSNDGRSHVQRQTYCRMKKGTQLQNEAGLRLVEAMSNHGIRPRAVRSSMSVLENKKICEEFRRPKTPILHELFCFEDSLLSAAASRSGAKVWRWGEPSHDLSNMSRVREVESRVRRDTRAGHDVSVWISLPCSPWSAWQRVNRQVSLATRVRIDASRSGSRKLLVNMRWLIQRLSEHPAHGQGCF